MFQLQDTTTFVRPSTRWQPTTREGANVEFALSEANIAPDELYHNTARRGHWQIEVLGGCAKEIARNLNNTPGFWEARGVQDFLFDEPLALISFYYEVPEESDRFFWVDRN